MVLLTLQAIEFSTFFLDYNRMKRSIYENVRKALRTPSAAPSSSSMHFECGRMVAWTTTTALWTIPTELYRKYNLFYFTGIHQPLQLISAKLITGGFALRSPTTTTTLHTV